MKPVVLVTRKLPDAVEARLRRDYDPILNLDDALYSSDEIIERAKGADAILPCHTEQFTAEVIARLPERVRVIANNSVGYDHVDTEAAIARGLVVTNTPDVLSDATAELTMMLMLGDFLGRFERASTAGFMAVEYMFPYGWPKTQLAEVLASNGLEQVLHNLPAGDWAAGERGIACLPGREGEFQDGVGKAIAYAKALKCPSLNCLVGLTPREMDQEKVHEVLVGNLQFAATRLAEAGIRLLVEALNDQDIPGFHLVRSQSALDLLADVGHPNLRLQYDIYHMQKMEGNLIATLDTQMARIGHIQLADNPGRHEPGTGEINFPNLFRAIDAAGYKGWIGCEYIPAGTTEEGLGWFSAYQN